MLPVVSKAIAKSIGPQSWLDCAVDVALLCANAAPTMGDAAVAAVPSNAKESSIAVVSFVFA